MTIEDLVAKTVEELGWSLDETEKADMAEFARRLFALRDADAVPVRWLDIDEKVYSHKVNNDCAPLYTHAHAPSELEAEVERLKLAAEFDTILNEMSERQIDELRQQLAESQAECIRLRDWLTEEREAALKQQEPVGVVGRSGSDLLHYYDGVPFMVKLQPGTKLYTAPATDYKPIAERLCKPAGDVADFINKFKRHVGGDGEFWLHELEDFYDAAMAKEKA